MNILALATNIIKRIPGTLPRDERIARFGIRYVNEYDKKISDIINQYKNKISTDYLKNAIYELKKALYEHEQKMRYIGKEDLLKVKENISILEKELSDKKLEKYFLLQEIVTTYKKFFINE